MSSDWLLLFSAPYWLGWLLREAASMPFLSGSVRMSSLFYWIGVNKFVFVQILCMCPAKQLSCATQSIMYIDSLFIYVCMWCLAFSLYLTFHTLHVPLNTCYKCGHFFFDVFFLMRPFKTQVQFFFSDGPCLLCCLGGKCFFIWIDLLSDCRLVVNKVCDIVIESKGKDCGPSTLSGEGSSSMNLFTTFDPSYILNVIDMFVDLVFVWMFYSFASYFGDELPQ